METLAVEAVLVAEFGRNHTRAYLLDIVDGTYRFVARGEAVATLEPPHEDATISLQAAVQQVEYIAGRKLLRRDRLMMPEAANGDGLDSFVAIANLTDPWRLAILDAGAGQAEITAVADTLRRMDVLVYVIQAPTRGGRPADWLAQHGAALATWRPDSLLMLAAPGASAETVGRMISLVKTVAGPAVTNLARLDEARSQIPVFAAMPEAIYTQVADQLTTRTNLRLLAEPTAAGLADRLVTELTKLIADRAADHVPGYEALTAWSNAPVVSRQRATGLVSQYLALSTGRRVALLDLDEALSLSLATKERLAGAVVADTDLGSGLPNLLSMVGHAAIQRWLPFAMPEDALTHWALNRALRPLTLTVSLRDQLIEQAFAREAAQAALSRLGQTTAVNADLVIGSQLLARWSTPATAVAVLLDSLQPTPEAGAVTLALDLNGILPAMGALAQVEPTAAAAVLEQDALAPLGTCLVVNGGVDGQRVASISVRRPSGNTTEVDVAAGSLALIPLGVSETASIRLTLENRATLGSFKAGQTVQLEAPTHVRGGLAGLIVDARGRPLALPNDGRRRQERLREWLVALRVIPAGGGDLTAL